MAVQKGGSVLCSEVVAIKGDTKIPIVIGTI